MLLLELMHKLNLPVIEITIPDRHYISANYYHKSGEKFHNVLYLPLNDDIIDPEYTYLFVNKVPSDRFKNYVLIRTEKSMTDLLFEIQNEFISSLNLSTDLSLLANIVTGDKSLENVLRIATGIINNPISLCNTSYEVIYADDNNMKYQDPIWEYTKRHGVLSREHVAAFEHNNLTKRVTDSDDPIIWSDETNGVYPKLSQRVMGQKGVIGYLSILLINSGNLNQTIQLAKQLSYIVANLMEDSSVKVGTKNQLRKYFLSHLLKGVITNREDLTFQLTHIGFKESEKYRLISVSYKGDKPIYNTDFYLNAIMGEHLIGTTVNGHMILLIGYQDNFEQKIKTVLDTVSNEHFVYLISPAFEDLFDSEKVMHMINSSFEPKKQINYIDDYLQVLHTPPGNLYNYSYEVLLKRPNGFELIKSLAAFIECNLNVSECAKALFIHRNTMMYRLERIRSEGHINLDNYLELMNFYIYYCAKNNIL